MDAVWEYVLYLFVWMCSCHATCHAKVTAYATGLQSIQEKKLSVLEEVAQPNRVISSRNLPEAAPSSDIQHEIQYLSHQDWSANMDSHLLSRRHKRSKNSFHDQKQVTIESGNTDPLNNTDSSNNTSQQVIPGNISDSQVNSSEIQQPRVQTKLTESQNVELHDTQKDANETASNSTDHEDEVIKTKHTSTDTDRPPPHPPGCQPPTCNLTLPHFYRNRSQDVTSSTICVAAVLVLLFGLILYSRMWTKRDQWLQLSVTLEEQDPTDDHHSVSPRPTTHLSIKDLIEGKWKIVQSQLKKLQMRNKRHADKNGKYTRIRETVNPSDKSDDEEEIFSR